MERLLQLNKDNPEIFKKVILEKIKREKEHSNEGRSLDQILQIFGVEGNAYLKKPQFDAYKVFTAVTEDGEW